MVDRYWVGGPGRWNETTHWAASSNGTPGQSVPKSTDNVFFDQNSGAFTPTSYVYVNAVLSCASLNCTGFAGNIATTVGSSLTIYGDTTLSPTTVMTSSGGPLLISNQTTNTVNIATNNAIVNCNVSIKGLSTASPFNIVNLSCNNILSIGTCTVNLPSSGINCSTLNIYATSTINFGSSGTSRINVTAGGVASQSVVTITGTTQTSFSGIQRPTIVLSYTGKVGSRGVGDQSGGFDYIWYGADKLNSFNGTCKTADLTNFTGTMATGSILYIKEDLLTASDAFALPTGTNCSIVFNGSGTQNINTSGFGLPKDVSFSGTGTYVFQSNAKLASGTDVGSFTLNSGTVNLNGKTVTSTNFTITGTCGLAFNSGKFVCTGSTSVWTATGAVITCTGPGVIELTNPVSQKNFKGGNNVYSGVTLTLSGAGITFIGDSNTFASIKNTVAPLTAQFQTQQTTIFTDNFELNGTSPASKINITSNVASGAVVNAPNFAKPSGIVVCYYANISWNNAGYTGSPATSGFTSKWTTGAGTVLGTSGVNNTTGWGPSFGALNFLPIFYP